MKRVRFNEETQTYHPVMQGNVYWIKKEPLSSEGDVQQRRSPFQTKRQRCRDTLRHSRVLRKATYSEAKRQKTTKAFGTCQCSVVIHGHGHCCCGWKIKTMFIYRNVYVQKMFIYKKKTCIDKKIKHGRVFTRSWLFTKTFIYKRSLAVHYVPIIYNSSTHFWSCLMCW